MKVILYTRVSTDDQAKYGYSLAHQKEVLTLYCKINGHEIVEHFEEDYSAKNFNRPAFTKLMLFIKANKKSIGGLLFTRWDRFSRNIEAALKIISQLDKMGVVVNASEQPLDLTNPDQKLLLAVSLTIPEIENDKNSIRTKEGMRRAMKEGYWVGSAPLGYMNCRNEQKKPTLRENEKAELVRLAFQEMSTGLKSAEEIRKQLRPRGMNLCKQAFLNLLRNPVYIGKIEIPEWKKEDAQIVEGVHPALITDTLFQMVGEILSGKRNLKFKPNKRNEDLFLRGFLLCPICSGNLTGSPSTGTGGTYFYYHCNHNEHRVRFRADKANFDFIQYLSSFKPPQYVVDTYYEVLRDIAKEKGKDKLSRIKSIQTEIETYEAQLEKADDRLINETLEESAYKRISDRYTQRIYELKMEKEVILGAETHFEKHIKFGVNLLANLSEIFTHVPIEVKHQIISLFFPEKLQYENGNYRTNKINQALALMAQLSSPSRMVEKKKPVLLPARPLWLPLLDLN